MQCRLIMPTVHGGAALRWRTVRASARAATGPWFVRMHRRAECASLLAGSHRLPTHRPAARAVHAAGGRPDRCDTHTNGLSAGRQGPALLHAWPLRAFHVQRVARQGMEKLPLVDRREDEEDANFQEAQSATFLGLGKNVVLTLGKGVVGVTASSSALIADAVHSLSDIVADLVALATLKVSRLPANRRHPYGHGKFEPIGALCVSSMLVGAGGGLVWHSAVLVQSAEAVAVPGVAALWISLAAVGLNEALFHITLRAGEKSRSQTVIANAWHHRSDALSSVVAMAGIGGAMVGFPMLDPLAGGAVGLMIAKTGGEMVWESVKDLTDTQDEEVIERLDATIAGVAGVAGVKSVRHRRMGPYQVADAHVLVHQELSVSAASQVIAKCRAAVRAEMPDVTEMMVHVSAADGYGRGRPPDQGWKDRLAASEHVAEADYRLEGLRSHEDVEEDVRRVVGSNADVKWIEHVSVHYLGGLVQVRCSIVLDDALMIRDANLIARTIRQKIEANIADVNAADIHLELEDNCWGQCGEAVGPACAVAGKMQRSAKVLNKGEDVGAPLRAL